MRPPTPSRTGATAALALATVLMLVGCATSARPAASPGAPIRVLAAESTWGSIAEQLGGAKAQVTSVIANPNTDPHDYEPTVADARNAADASIVVYTGAGYDSWVGRLLAASPNPARIELNVGDRAGVSAGGNPHLWYSPSVVHAVARRITEGYKRLDPADAAYFDQRQTAFESQSLAKYDALVAQIASDYAGTPIGASESIVVPLAEALHLRILTPPSLMQAVSEGVDPSAADKTAVDRQIKSRQIRVFIYNRQNSTPDVMALVAEANAAGVPVVTVTETPEPAGATFQDWQTSQLQRIADALRKTAGR